MRTTIALVVAGLCALAIAGPVPKPCYKVDDKVFLEKRKDVLRLFNYINQPSYYEDFVEIADAFKWEGNWNQLTKLEYAKKDISNFYFKNVVVFHKHTEAEFSTSWSQH